MEKLAVFGACGLFSGGIALAFADANSASTWIAAAVAVCAAFSYLARLIWRASKLQQSVLDKIDDQDSRLNRLMPDIMECMTELSERAEKTEERMNEALQAVARIEARCEERAKSCARLFQKGSPRTPPTGHIASKGR